MEEVLVTSSWRCIIWHLPIIRLKWKVFVIFQQVFRCCHFTENLSPPTVFKISGCVFFCILLTTKLSTICWNRFLNFCLKNFLRLFKVKFFKKKFFFWFWKAVKNFWDKNSKIRLQKFVHNLVVSRMPQPAYQYLENCKRRSIFRETGTAKNRNR